MFWLGGVTPSYILHTRAFKTYLLGGRVIFLAENILRWWYFTYKKPENIICDGILHVNMFHYFEIHYFTCTFFTKFIYNEYIGPHFLSHVVSKFFSSELPECFGRRFHVLEYVEVGFKFFFSHSLNSLYTWGHHYKNSRKKNLI